MAVNRTEFILFYEANYRRVYNYISYRINNRSDVEDLVSQVFTKALMHCASYDDSKGTPEMWIIGIARNAITDHFRRSAIRSTTDIDSIAQQSSTDMKPDELLIQKEERAQLLSALDTLSDRERQVIALKYGADMSNRQIAKLMDLTLSNIGVILFRSLRKLRKRLEREVHG